MDRNISMVDHTHAHARLSKYRQYLGLQMPESSRPLAPVLRAARTPPCPCPSRGPPRDLESFL